ncbi:PhoX family protein [Candidatus Skiveiella danica]|jgi:secreted PhoX family phosphatase|uniref:PhoX family protein n=2 Tax=Candidatus Skiveiella danica TaxID=3386177 RepID=UPI001B5E71AC|nr:PhoX family phosphatase [Burkholderiaceae bacterium]
MEHVRQHPDRRLVLQSAMAAVVAMMGPVGYAGTSRPPLGFTAVPASLRDAVVVPPEYEYHVLYRWGDPTGIGSSLPAFRPDASNTADDQALQAGMHHDGMHFFPLGSDGRRALLVLNHEYTDEHQLHADGAAPLTAAKVRKSQHAVGVSVIEIERLPSGWRQVLPSGYARRIHARTPMHIAGPAAGSALLQTAADPSGREVLGTLANCAMGVTPWGTYLTCEENFHGYFGADKSRGGTSDAAARRYGTTPGGQWVDWYRFDESFDVLKHPNESHRFGWVVEIDPMDPASTPIKRTALGRKCTESATCTLTRDGRVAVYMGDDARFEFIYKFVSRDRVRPGGYAANRDLLDHGTLYAARFDASGQGAWLELTNGDNGHADQAEVLVHARLGASARGATPMDRPEWVAIHPRTAEVFVSLTNNSQRGAPGRPAVDAANPRANNLGGHIMRWTEAGADAAATTFTWSHFVLAGDPAVPGTDARYPSPQADAFGAPDGLHFDSAGLLWIQTDMSGQAIGKGTYANLGNNALLCADLATGSIKRFLTGPNGSEITGCVVTPDRSTLFVNIQHPGETSDSGGARANSAWPDGSEPGSARPRSAIVAVRRRNGGAVGT